MIKNIKYLPTVFTVTPKAQAVLHKRHDNDLLHLGCAAIRNAVISNDAPKSTFWGNLKSMFGSTTRMNTCLDVNSDGKFVLSTARRINQYRLIGDEVVIDLEKIALSKKALVSAILKSKQGILDDIVYLKSLVK